MADRPQDIDDYLALFLSDTPMIDTRAPVEFAKGAFPAAVNLPLMLDDERARVGTCYKEQGQDAAIELGHQLVQGDIKAERVQAWLDFARANPDGVLYCFRGGLRSQICQQWLREAGCDYPRVTGGYKALRWFLIDQMERICREHPLIVLAGRTGVAKTDLLVQLPQSVDLEGRANHRGSAFGRRVGGQPSQIDFENAVAIDLLRCHHRAPDTPILVEDESHLIGRCVLPMPLKEAMERAPLALLEVSLEERVEHTYTNYILRKLAEWSEDQGEEAGFERFAEDLRVSLGRIRKRLGGVRYEEMVHLLEQSLSAHRRGDPQLHRVWIRRLLEDYYDPMYRYQLSKKSDRIVVRGGPEEVFAYLAEHYGIERRPDAPR
ncbi:tRNA 2-selenouridine(34) synthase MnmH [Marinimicrobium sp. LS-A18]|uniref:tRNA 2-selenouridine(34) synthase MnmH n=1 Tax=Marinimicrobium sp. LS-A18 TaxID=1381596 RepID=UPI0004639B97|nr:tRNA 2-selenouridine(34) synthase MnmH [Marinimicrobium sp. LS-A18]